MRRSSRSTMVLLLSLAVGLAGLLAPGSSAHAVGTATLSGTVTSQAGVALAGVDVTVYSYDAAADWWGAVDDTSTSRDGTYTLTGLEPNTYRLGFDDASGAYAGEYHLDATTVDTATSIGVAAGATVAGVNASLAVAGRVSGMVLGAHGGALDDIYVSAHRWDAAQEWWAPVSDAWTSLSGKYDMGGLPTGTYRLRFIDYYGGHLTEYWNDAASFPTATDLGVTSGTTTANTNAQLALGGAIAGTVTAAIAFMDVWAVAYEMAGGTWQQVREVQVADDGSYRLDELPAGTYRIAFQDLDEVLAREFWDDKPTIGLATDIVVASGVTAGGRDAVLAVTPPVTPTPTPVATPIPAPTPSGVEDPAREIATLLAAVKVSGKPVVGRTLTVKNLIASFRGTVGYKIQWYAGRTAIKKATKAKLRLTSALKGKVVSVKVRATAGGVTKTRRIRVGTVRG